MSKVTSGQSQADHIITLERNALDRWGNGDPNGFLELYATDITYFDPLVEARIDGHPAMAHYYHPFIGKIHIARYEMLNPQVVVAGAMALLTYNLVNYICGDDRAESVGSRWNSTVVYRQLGDSWKSLHSHWSFTCHAALRNISPEASEGL